MAKILVTGAKGQLGCELKMASRNYFGYDFIFTDVDTLDITDSKKTYEFIHRSRPDWIINCAAYNLVDKAESEYETAVLINGLAVKNISTALTDSTCRFIHISSDYVFDGTSNIPYSEYSPVNPLSAYGRSKLEGERSALLHHGSMVIRTSWLYSSYGKNFVKTMLTLGSERESVNVVSDQKGNPTYAGDLAEAILQIVSGVNRQQIAFNAGIYHFSNEGECSWFEFADAIMKEAGLNCTVNAILTKDYPTDAKRPAYSGMNKKKITDNYGLKIPEWRTSLRKCIKIIKNS